MCYSKMMMEGTRHLIGWGTARGPAQPPRSRSPRFSVAGYKAVEAEQSFIEAMPNRARSLSEPVVRRSGRSGRTLVECGRHEQLKGDFHARVRGWVPVRCGSISSDRPAARCDRVPLHAVPAPDRTLLGRHLGAARRLPARA